MRSLLYLFLLLFINNASEPCLINKTNTPTKNIKTFGVEYFSVNDKKILTYKSDFGDTKSWFSTDDSLIVFHNESDNFQYRQKLLINDKGVFVKETYQRIKVFLFINKEGTYTYSKPLLRIPFPIDEGSQWTWDGKEFCDGDTNTVSVTGKIVGLDTVTTDAGKFEAMKIESVIQSSEGTKNILTEWFAAGIGMVKLHLVIEGSGFASFIKNILGYGNIDFELEKISPD